MLSERRKEAASTAFFIKAVGNNGWPEKVMIDKSGPNTRDSLSDMYDQKSQRIDLPGLAS